MRTITALIFINLWGYHAFSQINQSASSAILHELYKLKNPTRILYVAAHPDDENTRMISWLANGVGCETAYLSLTRGDGGQNLIGEELGAKLGVLRTQELMQARNIDGGRQYFSRAVDFGYSKSAGETLEKWGEEKVLHDVVLMIRKFRPDVIITRFPPDARGGHGHHTASAVLAVKAFEKAGDESVFPEQLQHVKTWKAKRIYWNTSIWWGEPLDSLSRTDDRYLKVDVGAYNPILGVNYNELASLSRTQHKSQGFGVSVKRGRSPEYLYYLAGDKAKADLFEDLGQSWSRHGFKEGDGMLQMIIDNFDPADPSASVEALFKLKNEAEKINDPVQQSYFRQKLEEIILSCIGWHAELLGSGQYIQDAGNVELNLEVLVRSGIPITLKEVGIGGRKKSINTSLAENVIHKESLSFIAEDQKNAFSQPYWLEKPYTNLFEVGDIKKIGKPENDSRIKAELSISIAGNEMKTEVAATYKYSDRVKGEIITPVFITPKAIVNPLVKNLVFVKKEMQQLPLEIRFLGNGTVQLKFSSPDNTWEIEPKELLIDPQGKATVNITLQVTPLAVKNDRSKLTVLLDDEQALALTEIEYEHIDKRLVFEPAEVKLIKLNLQKRGSDIGYIPGAGDEVAQAIEQLGYQVDILDEEKIRKSDLSKYHTIIAGIRAYNTESWLPGVKDVLMEYVKNGGNYIVQYNTLSRDLLSQDIGPYPFQISRERVTEEDAEAEFLLPDHPVLNEPNKLSKEDFENWVQERGLYFAGSWDDTYEAPIGWHDKGENSRNGSLIIAHHGKGAFMYTGISFFRELPAGVPGAFRLLANLLSYENPASYEQQ